MEEMDPTRVIPDAAIREYVSLSSFPRVCAGGVLNFMAVKSFSDLEHVDDLNDFGGRINGEEEFFIIGSRLGVEVPSLFFFSIAIGRPRPWPWFLFSLRAFDLWFSPSSFLILAKAISSSFLEASCSFFSFSQLRIHELAIFVFSFSIRESKPLRTISKSCAMPSLSFSKVCTLLSPCFCNSCNLARNSRISRVWAFFWVWRDLIMGAETFVNWVWNSSNCWSCHLPWILASCVALFRQHSSWYDSASSLS